MSTFRPELAPKPDFLPAPSQIAWVEDGNGDIRVPDSDVTPSTRGSNPDVSQFDRPDKEMPHEWPNSDSALGVTAVQGASEEESEVPDKEKTAELAAKARAPLGETKRPSTYHTDRGLYDYDRNLNNKG